MTVRIAYSFDESRRAPEITYALHHLFRVAGLEGFPNGAGRNRCDARMHYGFNPPLNRESCLWIRPSEFFGEHYGTSRSLPASPVTWFETAPVFFVADDTRPKIEPWTGGLTTGADLVASTFFLLSGYEETINTQRDEHGRFLARFSVIGKREFQTTPWVDRYAGIFRKLFTTLIGRAVPLPSWDGQGCALALTHDVDSIRRPRLRVPIGSGATEFKKARTALRPFMELESEHNVRSTVFFLVRSHEQDKHPYDINDPAALQVLREAQSCRAEIGLHGSYDCLQHPDGVEWEREAILKLDATVEGFRQHYLRVPAGALQLVEESGFSYDSSLGWPDAIGFRHGTAWPFHPFCFARRRSLKLLEIPLVIMDRTLAKYSSLDADSALPAALAILDQVNLSGGCAAILWHHEFCDELRHPSYGKLYAHLIGWTKGTHARALTCREIVKSIA